jgi:hypothetical protein
MSLKVSVAVPSIDPLQLLIYFVLPEPEFEGVVISLEGSVKSIFAPFEVTVVVLQFPAASQTLGVTEQVWLVPSAVISQVGSLPDTTPFVSE